MLKLITKSLNKVFGTKSDRDIKDVQPLVKQIVAEYEKLNNISNDELRDITTQLKATIKQGTQDILDTIEAKKLEAEGVEDANLEAKVSLYEEIDQLLKDKDVALEKVLLEILPKAFAVVRETARRFKENTEIIVTASDFDRELATFTAPLKPVKIDGNKAIWSNTWDAAGNSVTWDMLHYEVQLIGGIVLHQGKIAEMGTGEGKTLVATLPAYLNAISGEGVHIVTVND